MTVKQLIEDLAMFDEDATVQIAFPTGQNHLERFDTDVIQVIVLDRHDGRRPLISVNGAHLLEE